MPAVINILLGAAPARRDRAGRPSRHRDDRRDVHLRLVRLAFGHATGKFPGPGELRLAGGSPRYQLYPTRDGKLVACGALEQKFWLAFCNAIGLPAPLMNDLADPAATKAAVAEIIGARPPSTGGRNSPQPIAASPSWRRSKRRCTIRISSSAGCSRIKVASATARPCRRCRCRLPRALREKPGTKAAPKLGADNDLLGSSRLAPSSRWRAGLVNAQS